jgi:hypothetical protein
VGSVCPWSSGYKEFEVNALNTTWDLLLNAPYGADGGYENSSRTLGAAGWSMTPPLRSATRVEGGQINSPAAGPSTRWSVEIALPVAQLAYNTTAGGAGAATAVDVDGAGGQYAPKAGDVWRINFSRVEWYVVVSSDGKTYWKDTSRGDQPDNWVWSPQGRGWHSRVSDWSPGHTGCHQ